MARAYLEGEFGLNPLKRVNSILTRQCLLAFVPEVAHVSIPSNGSIQFLHASTRIEEPGRYFGLNPLTRVNSILSKRVGWLRLLSFFKSQSPQTGQFNSYTSPSSNIDYANVIESQSPQTGQFNSYKNTMEYLFVSIAKSQSPQTGQFNSYNWKTRWLQKVGKCLNPLKRVNSILTRLFALKCGFRANKSLNPLKRVNSILTVN